jgi:ketosteroid isomerase-like protein
VEKDWVRRRRYRPGPRNAPASNCRPLTASRFDVVRVISSGPPWDILVAAEWVADVTPAAGDPYANQGTHVIRIPNGRVVYFQACEDSAEVARACELMAAQGVEGAAAASIVG